MYTYMATNTLNGKFYIGSTNNFEKRKNNHLCSKLNYPFQNALHKNPDAFVWEVWQDDSEEPILEQALLDMWFGKSCCYNLNPKSEHPPHTFEICQKGGKTVHSLKKGIHSPEWLDSEDCLLQRKKNGLKSYSEGKGYFSLTPEEKREVGLKVGTKLLESKKGLFDPDYVGSERKTDASRRGGVTQGNRHKEQKTGLFDPGYLNSEKKKEDSSKGGSKARESLNKQRWQCTVTGYISTPGGLSRYQKSRGIDTSNRTRIS